MAAAVDLQNFAIAPASAGSWRISYQLCDTRTGAVLVDHTGASSLLFPAQFAAANVTAQLAFVGQWAMDIIRAADPAAFA